MPSNSSNQVLALRALLRERFPKAQAQARSLPQAKPASDKSLLSVISSSPGEIREFVAERPGCGGALLIGELLEHSFRNHQPLALVDGRDSFDPESYGSRLCRQLLWLRCQDAEQAIQATDLLLRDGNLPSLLLDLQLNSLAEIRALPPSAWHRFRNLAEQSGATLLVLSPAPLVTSAHNRFVLRAGPSSNASESPRKVFSCKSQVEWLRHRSFHGRLSA